MRQVTLQGLDRSETGHILQGQDRSETDHIVRTGQAR